MHSRWLLWCISQVSSSAKRDIDRCGPTGNATGNTQNRVGCRPVCFTQRYTRAWLFLQAANKKEECVIDNTCITRLAQGRQSSCHGTPFSLRERLDDRNWERERGVVSLLYASKALLFAHRFCSFVLFSKLPPSKQNDDYFPLLLFYGTSAGGRAGKTAGSVRLRGLASGRVVGRDGRTLRRWLVSETLNFYFSLLIYPSVPVHLAMFNSLTNLATNRPTLFLKNRVSVSTGIRRRFFFSSKNAVSRWC